MQAFNDKKWKKLNSEKVAALAYAQIQGKAALVAHFQNSSLMSVDKLCRPISFCTDGPNSDLNESTREITGAVALEPQPSALGFAPLTFPMRSVEQIMAAQSDIEANQYTLKSCVETMTAVTNLSHRLQSRTNEVQQLNAQLALLQRIYKDVRAEICVLKAENKELKRKANLAAIEVGRRS
ncbi:hypothetical protein TEA_021794 [Camellia sinensis var. sinensis]|uniref:Mei2-like C-terminal RNA recognition motif domain-containing protein n=1 Tax=Camellia sinensis var. sinensis TaxID=542762 RepID=A0A4S4DVU0_CAMSN|nr:hypothetical protein TEA_021794 [Camellia sinensis var. sinensis]